MILLSRIQSTKKVCIYFHNFTCASYIRISDLQLSNPTFIEICLNLFYMIGLMQASLELSDRVETDSDSSDANLVDSSSPQPLEIAMALRKDSQALRQPRFEDYEVHFIKS